MGDGMTHGRVHRGDIAQTPIDGMVIEIQHCWDGWGEWYEVVSDCDYWGWYDFPEFKLVARIKRSLAGRARAP